MKILKIGTFKSDGSSIGWELDFCQANDDGTLVCIKDEKVFIGGVEIVELTNKRNEIMKKNLVPNKIKGHIYDEN